MSELNNKIQATLNEILRHHDHKADAHSLDVQAIQALITEQIRLGREKWLDGQIQHLLVDIYPEDLFTPPTDEDYKKANDFDANLHTRLHCDGIRHGLQVLRREVRGLSARDDLPPISDTTLLEGEK